MISPGQSCVDVCAGFSGFMAGEELDEEWLEAGDDEEPAGPFHPW